MSSLKRCWAEIDLSALRHNAAVVRRQIGPHPKIMAIVKANAYGHGVEKVAQALLGRGSRNKCGSAYSDMDPVVEMFGVANLREAVQLSEIAEPHQIFILGAALPFEREEIVKGGFIATISTLEEALAYDEFSRRLCKPSQEQKVHLVVDSGMGRMGAWKEESIDLVKAVLGNTRLRVCGVATHLPVPDEDEPYTQDELKSFERIVVQLQAAGVSQPLVHSLNSAGVIRFAEHACDMVRVGLMLYGSSPIAGFQEMLKPVMTIKTRVALLRELPAGRSISYGRTYVTERPTRVATLPIGYADGYQRALSNRGTEVLVGGKRCKVLGRVTMDQIMVDVTARPNVRCGDEAVLIGRQGDEQIHAAELAEKAGTIPWEIFTGIKNRVERVYI